MKGVYPLSVVWPQKALRLIVLLCSSAITTAHYGLAQSPDHWSSERAPSYVNRSASISLNGKIYVFGSDDPSGADSSFSRAYDPVANQWETLSVMPIRVGAPAAATVNGLIYVIGGYDPDSGAVFNPSPNQVYDPSTDTWQPPAPSPNVARAFATAQAVGNKIYLIGGYPGGTTVLALDATEQFDPATGGWLSMRSMPTARNGLASAVVGGMIYVIGGSNGSNVLGAMEAYDPSNNMWSKKMLMPTARAEFGAASLNGKIFAFGGVTPAGSINANEEYDPSSDIWVTPAPASLPVTMGGNTGAAVNGLAYSIGINRTDGSAQVNYAYTPLPTCHVNPIDVLIRVENNGTTMLASFAPNSSTFPGALFAAASACGFKSFNWQQTITNMPCPSPFFPVNFSSVPSVNFCPSPTRNALTATPDATFLDPPSGGFTYDRPYDPFPFYYPVAYVLAPNVARIWDPFTHEVDIPIVDTSGGVLSFSDNPVDSCLPGGNPNLCDPVPGLLDAPGSMLGFTTAIVGVKQDGTPSPPLYQWTWTDTFNGTSGGISTLSNPNPVDPGSGTGGITITSVNGVPQTPPTISCTATPNLLWPPNGKQVSVSVSGSIVAGTSAIEHDSPAFLVTDSEGQLQPSGSVTLGSDGTYSLAISLVASRDGSNKSGRQYTVQMTARDVIGNLGSCLAVVTVPHDQGD